MLTHTYYRVFDSTLYYGNWAIDKLSNLTRNGSATVPPSRIRQWRYCAHNLVVHPLYGDAVTLVTDGVHVVIDLKDGQCVEVVKESLRGPIDRNIVDPDDWDWERNTRRVHVFRRGDNEPPVIIPFNRWMDKYWDRFSKLDQYEHLAYQAIATQGVDPTSFDTILAKLHATVELSAEQAASEKLSRVEKMNRRVQELLEGL